MACRTLWVKLLTAALSLTLVLAASGCAPVWEEKETAETTADSVSTEITTGSAEKEAPTLPTYERNPQDDRVPSETRFGEGDYGTKEELKDVAP